MMYWKAPVMKPPLQPLFPYIVEQSTRFWVLRDTSFPVFSFTWASRAPTALNAQHDPQAPCNGPGDAGTLPRGAKAWGEQSELLTWFFTSVTHPCSLQSMVSGTLLPGCRRDVEVRFGRWATFSPVNKAATSSLVWWEKKTPARDLLVAGEPGGGGDVPRTLRAAGVSRAGESSAFHFLQWISSPSLDPLDGWTR